MAKYRKKPVVIEAIQWGENGFKGQAPWLEKALSNGTIKTNRNGTVSVYTLEGIHIGLPGDFIVQGIQGEL